MTRRPGRQRVAVRHRGSILSSPAAWSGYDAVAVIVAVAPEHLPFAAATLSAC